MMSDRDYYRYECEDWDEIGYPSEAVLDEDIYIDDFHMDERWLPLYNYNGMYWVSTHGRVWSRYSHWFLEQRPYNNYGHLEVELAVPGRRKRHRGVHILVAEAFIPNPHHLPNVLHGDDDPTNNCVRNLRWGTQADNVRDCIERGRFRYFTREDVEAANKKRATPIVAKNIKTGVLLHFVSQQEASRQLGINQSDISDIVRHERTHQGNWTFAYEGEELLNTEEIDPHRFCKNQVIIATNIITGEEYIFTGQTKAAEYLGLSIATISLILSGKTKNPKTWTFRYADER